MTYQRTAINQRQIYKLEILNFRIFKKSIPQGLKMVVLLWFFSCLFYK